MIQLENTILEHLHKNIVLFVTLTTSNCNHASICCPMQEAGATFDSIISLTWLVIIISALLKALLLCILLLQKDQTSLLGCLAIVCDRILEDFSSLTINSNLGAFECTFES